MYCIKHAQKYAAKPNTRTFHVDRTVWVDLDPEETVGRKRSKFVDFRDLQFSLGSVRFERLGSLVPASDTRPVSCHFYTLLQTQNLQVDLLFGILNISAQALVPVGLSARKTYWSILNPAKRTTYRCTTRWKAMI